MPRAVGHVEQGAALSTHLLQKVPRGDCQHTPRAAMSGVPRPRRRQSGRPAAQRPADANPRGDAQCDPQTTCETAPATQRRYSSQQPTRLSASNSTQQPLQTCRQTTDPQSTLWPRYL